MAAIPHLHGGSILLISSAGRLMGVDACAAYGASNGAVELLVKSLAVEEAPSGIQVTRSCPATTPLGSHRRSQRRCLPVVILLSDFASITGATRSIDAASSSPSRVSYSKRTKAERPHEPASDARRWGVDSLVAGTGNVVLHPEARHLMAQTGSGLFGFDRVLLRVQSSAMFPKAWSEVAAEVERKASYYEGISFSTTAGDFSGCAALLFAQAQHSFAAGGPREEVFRSAVNRCPAGVARLSARRIERPFEGKNHYGSHTTPG